MAGNETPELETDEQVEKEDTTHLSSNKKSPKTKKHGLFLIITILLVIAAVPVLLAGWFGFIPGLSTIMGARTPVDLGVEWTEADYESYLSKTNANFVDVSQAPVNPANPNKKVIFADPVTVSDQTFTQEELTAAINSIGWAWMPISNAQVRFQPGTVEVSGNLELDSIEKFIGFIGGVGYSDEDVQSTAAWGRRFVNGAPVYIKANASVQNDQLAFQLDSVKIGRFSVPQDIANTVLYTGSTNSINNAQNFSAQNVTFTDGALQFSGTYPTTIYVRR